MPGIWKNLLSVSAMVSDSENEGHFFWYYRRLAEEFGENNGVAVIGPKCRSVGDSVWWRPILNPPKGKLPLSPRPRKTFMAEMQEISQIIDGASTNSFPAIQFYDGCLDDLVALCYLAPRFPNVAFIFNFRPGKYWLPILSRGKIRRLPLRRLFRSKPRNVFLTAETPVLSVEIAQYIGVLPEIYPLYSSQDFVRDVPFQDRGIDVSFFPKSQAELELCRRLTGELRKITDHHALVVIPDRVFARSGGLDFFGFDQTVRGPVNADRYREIFENSKVVFLPYLKEYFQYGSSGKFNDALLAGAIPLVPEGSAPVGQTKTEGIASDFEFNPGDVSATVAKIMCLFARAEGFSEKESGVSFEDFRAFVFEKTEAVKNFGDGDLSGWSKGIWLSPSVYGNLVGLEAYCLAKTRLLRDVLFRSVHRAARTVLLRKIGDS